MVSIRPPPRAVFLSHTAVLGGAELCLLDAVPEFRDALVLVFEEGPLVERLRARGTRVEVLAAPRAVSGVRRTTGRLTALRALPGVWRLSRAVARLTRDGDVLYANSQKSWIIAALVAWWYRRTVVWHLHDILSRAHFSPFLVRTAVWLANRFAAAVIVNSATTAEAFVANGGKAALVRVIHNGIDAAPFAAVSAEQVATLRREIGLDAASFTVGVFGRIAPWKGQHVMLEALLDLPDVHVLVVGAPLFGEHEYLELLERRARDPAVAGRVRFLGFRADIPIVMQAVDVVVHTSTSPEPFGRVVVEAQLAGKPVVATAMGGVLEIVEHGVDGLLVSPADAGVLARVIGALRDDPALRERLAAAGHRKAARRFSVAAMRAALAGVAAAARSAGRIVLVSHSAEPSGAELSLIDLATFFGSDTLVCLFQQGPVADMLRERGVRVEVLSGSPRLLRLRGRTGVLAALAAIPAIFELGRALAANVRQGDLLYANSQKAWIVAAFVALWRGHRVVWHLRDILSAAHFGVLQRVVATRLANLTAAGVLVNSAATGAAFVASGGRRELTRVVHNGIDETPFVALRAAEVLGPRNEPALRGRATVGLFGRLARWKGQHVLLAALERLDGIDALIVGDALFGEHDYRDELLTLAAAPALVGRVRFLGHRSDVPELMRAVDIVVHTSVEPEPFGRVIVEGMLAERPVIATRGGGVDEIIADGRDGLLVPPGDPAALAAAIGALVADPARARALAAAGCAKARQRFLLETMQHGVAAALRDFVPAHEPT